MLQPWSRRPSTSPGAVSVEVTELIVDLREELSVQGLDTGPHTIKPVNSSDTSPSTPTATTNPKTHPNKPAPPKGGCSHNFPMS